ncbi:expressed protein [Phakopsora pachyrhizi]|uniref:Expressed protein n=1 Tax=Phakopsora pachyrhizi TaxID=170000 RepID=A0AAV0AFK8_PHAPC|nr:expressed protein [Phakopsora pachyrhizi]
MFVLIHSCVTINSIESAGTKLLESDSGSRILHSPTMKIKLECSETFEEKKLEKTFPRQSKKRSVIEFEKVHSSVRNWIHPEASSANLDNELIGVEPSWDDIFFANAEFENRPHDPGPSSQSPSIDLLRFLKNSELLNGQQSEILSHEIFSPFSQIESKETGEETFMPLQKHHTNESSKKYTTFLEVDENDHRMPKSRPTISSWSVNTDESNNETIMSNHPSISTIESILFDEFEFFDNYYSQMKDLPWLIKYKRKLAEIYDEPNIPNEPLSRIEEILGDPRTGKFVFSGVPLSEVEREEGHCTEEGIKILAFGFNNLFHFFNKYSYQNNKKTVHREKLLHDLFLEFDNHFLGSNAYQHSNSFDAPIFSDSTAVSHKKQFSGEDEKAFFGSKNHSAQ